MDERIKEADHRVKIMLIMQVLTSLCSNYRYSSVNAYLVIYQNRQRFVQPYPLGFVSICPDIISSSLTQPSHYLTAVIIKQLYLSDILLSVSNCLITNNQLQMTISQFLSIIATLGLS